MEARNWSRILIAVLIVLFVGFSRFISLVVDYLWFDALGFKDIFTISLISELAVFAAAFILFFVFMYANLKISAKLAKKPFSSRMKNLIVLVLSLIIARIFAANWFVIQQYLNQVPFGVADPIFLKDAAFYIFSLPFFNMLWAFAMTSVILTAILLAIDYFNSFISGMFRPQYTQQPGDIPQYSFNWKNLPKLKRSAVVHLSVIASLFFALLAVRHYLARFSIMFSEQGIVVGAGYTDVVAYLPIIKILMVLAILMVVIMYIYIFYISRQPKLRKRHILGLAVGLYLLFFFVGPTLIPGLVQSFRVDPNEINLEKPYIENNIKFTRLAYGLDDVVERDFDVDRNLSADILEEEKETVDNVRVLDWRPLTQTYKQTQEIRLYYDLSGIDIDRYTVDGRYTQVLLAPRELDQSQITENAKTWVNLHMIYTHGYGVVMSPVNDVTTEGLPRYLIQDIPPVYTVDEPEIRIDNPQIYYSDKDNNYVLVNTETDEFDYPKGNTNEYINYDGEGGVQLSSFMRKLLMAFRFGDIKILLSSDVHEDSSIMFRRNIQERISTLTPFLRLDRDPYIVIEDGRVYWIQDAYTVTGNYPYSQKSGRINYIRNSVKVVVDAYDGDVSYYVVDKQDPLIRTYSRIFPQQFRLMEDMPKGLKDHIRYPVDLFEIQSQIYSTYHMSDPTVFYNKEDAWQIPNEIYGTGQKVEVEPYYIIMKLPDEEEVEFVLMTSFTPIKKDNMIAWMAGRNDGENYGNLILYKFPKERLVYGPLQIEAKFDQDSKISQQLTLWSQQGSSVTRGNLLVIPIRDSILYIEPLYIQAEKGQLPQLKRVLVSDGERVVMEETLKSSLEALFGKPTESEQKGETFDQQIDKANEYYDTIVEAMQQNDWSAMGESFDKLGEILRRLSE